VGEDAEGERVLINQSKKLKKIAKKLFDWLKWRNTFKRSPFAQIAPSTIE
jgi:hypothetical protein